MLRLTLKSSPVSENNLPNSIQTVDKKGVAKMTVHNKGGSLFIGRHHRRRGR